MTMTFFILYTNAAWYALYVYMFVYLFVLPVLLSFDGAYAGSKCFSYLARDAYGVAVLCARSNVCACEDVWKIILLKK